MKQLLCLVAALVAGGVLLTWVGLAGLHGAEKVWRWRHGADRHFGVDLDAVPHVDRHGRMVE